MDTQNNRNLSFKPEQVHRLLKHFCDLASRGFPHRCSCGRVYKNLNELLAKTSAHEKSSTGMVASMVGENSEVVDLFRN